MHFQEVYRLHISSIFILLWPTYYIIGVADDCQGISVELVLHF